MFSCAECSKDFLSQGSLARHLQNHSETVKHTCNVCGVFFRRRDLLTRHSKLHDNTSNKNKNTRNNNNNHDDGAGGSGEGEGAGAVDGEAGGAHVSAVSPGYAVDNHFAARTTTTGAGTGTVSRRRCHTACNRCRDRKIKCNGKNPCSRCLRAGNACDFDCRLRPSGRISQVHSAAVARASLSGSASLAPALGFAADAGDASHMALPPVFSPISFTDMSPDPGAIVGGSLMDHGGNHDIETALDVPSMPWDATFDQVTPWPWLHENLFLSRDESGILPTNGFQQLSFPGEHMLDMHLPAFQPLSTQGGDHDKEQDSSQAQSHQRVDGMGSCSGDNLDSVTAATSIAPPSGPYGPALLRPPLQDRDQDTRSPQENSACKQRAIDALVSLAAQAVKGTGDKTGTYPRPAYIWSRAPHHLVTSFHIELQPGWVHDGSTTEAALQHFVRLYSEHFHQLWPLLPRRTLESGIMHPLLYLVLASIGAMYMGGSGSECGTLLHNAVRQRLVLPVDLDESDDNLVWLAQARLLTQVAALYFGQHRAFSYAQHLGTLLTAQARRMCLFSETHHQQRLLQLKQMKGVAADALCLDLWLSIEERRRLAFGIFRGDTFTSVLLNIKPLVSLEEIALEFPTCNAVFNSSADLEPRLALGMIEHHQTPNQHVRASDIFHVLLERNETLPPLEPVAHEILLFGLQSHVWRFSRDRQLLDRLTAGAGAGADVNAGVGLADMPEGEVFASMEDLGCDMPRSSKKRQRDTFTSEVDSLDNRPYQMADLTSERQQLLAAMAKWERALPLAKTLARNEEDRSYLLSSLILYHLSFMRLYAPVDEIHQIHYRIANKQPVLHDAVANVLAWASSARARIAVKRVRSVWALITQETRQGQTRSQFNFNAYVGLHHGAGILWAYHGATDLEQMNESLSASSTSGPSSLRQGEGCSPTFSVQTDKAESIGLLQSFEDLFHAMSPARWSSFAEVAHALTTLVFPARGGPANDELQSR